MAVNFSESPIYRFDNVEVDPLRGRLKCDGCERHLRQKALSVLVCLIESGGCVVTKDELISRIWGDTAVVDDVLVQCIADIRRVLHDDRAHPRFIRTIPKIGYQFISPLIEDFEIVTTTHFQEVTHLEIGYQEVLEKDAAGWKTVFRSALAVFAGTRYIAVALVAASMAAAAFFIFGNSFFKAASEEVSPPVVPGKKSVAVIAFQNQSGDPELTWMSYGIADMLSAGLSRTEKLNVIDRERVGRSNEKAAGHQPSVSMEIARSLKADSLITGSFARLGDQFRVDVAVYDVNSGDLTGVESLVEKTNEILAGIDLLAIKLRSRLGAFQDAAFDTGDRAITSDLEAYRLYSLGVEKARAYHNLEAIELFQKAIARDPDFAMAHARIGYVYALGWGFPDKAKSYLEKAFAIKDRLSDKDRLHVASWYAIANRDYAGAMPPLRELITRYPLETEAYWRLGRLLISESGEEEAIDLLRQGLAIDPESKDICNLLGGILSQLGRHDEAIAMQQRYVASASGEPNAYDSLGMAFQRAGRYVEAAVQYERALEIKPDFEVAVAHLANTRFQQGRYRESIELYKKYVAFAPSNAECGRGHGRLSIIYARMRSFALSERSARRSLKCNDEDPAPLLAALETNRYANGWEDRLFRQPKLASRGVRTDSRVKFHIRSLIALREGHSDEAIESSRSALSYPPPTWDIMDFEDSLAYAYLKSGKFDLAIAEYQRILKINPNYPMAHLYIAEAFERSADESTAIEQYNEFLRIWNEADGDIPEIRIARDRIRILTRNLTLARR